MTGAAVISPDQHYRYALWRELPAQLGRSSTSLVLFVMLNPSTADGLEDAPTIRRCLGYASDWGHARLAVANLYAYRSTDPAALHEAADPVGPDNDLWIERLADEADRIIVAWGALPQPVADRPERVLQILGDDVEALALGASGQPRHPLCAGRKVEPIHYATAVEA